MKKTISKSVMIERFARANGLTFYRAAAELQKRAMAARAANRARAQTVKSEQERFEAMRKSRPDLY